MIPVEIFEQSQIKTKTSNGKFSECVNGVSVKYTHFYWTEFVYQHLLLKFKL